jgi:hypothetical protein
MTGASPEREMTVELVVQVRTFGHPDKAPADIATIVARSLYLALGSEVRVDLLGQPVPFDPIADDNNEPWLCPPPDPRRSQ